jgi:hypothetical protein
MDFEALEAPGRRKLSSRDCRLSLALDGGPVKRYLLGFDEIDVANLILPRSYWPRRPARLSNNAASGTETLAGLQLNYVPPTNSSETPKVGWVFQRELPPDAIDLHCFVYGQKNDADALKEIAKFSANNNSGTFEVDPSYRAGYVSMICESRNITLASNALDLGNSVQTAGQK